MSKVIFYLAAAFLTGNIILLYVHYNSSKNVNSLIGGNKKILAEIGVINELRELNKDIAAIEGRSRRVKLTDSIQIREYKDKIEKVRLDLDNLQKISDDDSTEIYIDRLDLLVHKKLNDSGIISTTMESHAGELNDSIRMVTHLIENSRQKLLLASTLTTERSGRKALYSGTLLIVIVLICGAILFLIILNRIVRQHELIQKLDISERKVRESARIKELFIANMSHEIRTPMNAIIGFTNLLQKKELDHESCEFVKTIQQSSETLLAIINDVLDLSKIEAGMMHIDSYPFSLSELFRSVISMFKARFEEKGINVVADLEEDLPDMFEGDPARLTQILMNLIGNALKFTNRGTVTIKISNEGIAGEYIQVGILIKDSGIGIRKDKLAFIFERFQQAENSITRNYGGTGLGLAIVKDLVTLQNGSISVKSEPGQGTCFNLIIPYKLYNGPSKTKRVEIFNPGSPVSLSEIEILVVEDNEVNKLLLRHLLKNWKVKYDLAGNGIQAVEKLRNRHYNIILMDIQMPEMDGYTATLEIRENLGLKTPIIAMTAHALQGEREKCLGYGMNDYISKPVHDLQLYELIVRYTGINPVSESIAFPSTPVTQKEFEHIDLAYMTEVGNGNIEYERSVTAEFLVMMPRELDSIRTAWKCKNTSQMKKFAHNMKTTISVMGLTEKLQPLLDKLEYNELNDESFTYLFGSLEAICEKALEEANLFYGNLPVV